MAGLEGPWGPEATRERHLERKARTKFQPPRTAAFCGRAQPVECKLDTQLLALLKGTP